MTSKKKMFPVKKAGTKKCFSDLISFESNDYGNAMRFLQFASGRALFDSTSSSWFLYDKGWWKPDDDKKRNVHKLADDLYSLLLQGFQKEYQDLEKYGIDVLESKAADIGDIDAEEDELIKIRERFQK